MGGKVNPFLRAKTYLTGADIPFLLFLLGVTSLKLPVKVAAIVLYFLFMRRKFRPAILSAQPALFYFGMPVIGLLGALMHGAFGVDTYWLGFALAAMIWLMGGMTFLLIKSAANEQNTQRINRSIELFFTINALVCLVEFMQMVVISQHPFPYWYRELDYIYGVSAGDHLHGIFRDNSTVNAAISLLGALYFLYAARYRSASLCVLVCLLCTSNLTIFIMLASLAFCFLLFKNRRKIVAAFLFGTVILYLIISPDNVRYVDRVVAKLKTQTENTVATAQPEPTVVVSKPGKTVAAPSVNDTIVEVPAVAQPERSWASQASIVHTGPFPATQILNDFAGPIRANLGTTSLHYEEHKPEDTMALRRVMAVWYGVAYNDLPLAQRPRPGKLAYAKNTYALLRSSVPTMVAGVGPGNYSSKLALKMTGLKLQGNYPERFRYLDRTYFENTFFLHMFYWAKSVPDRSIINYPGSVYNQVAGEYGLLGMALFAVCYLLYFLKRALVQPEKLAFIAALLGLFWFDYWFEMLTLTVFFELFMLTDAPKKPANKSAETGTETSEQNAG